jgi:hypothetical protein
MSTSDKLLPQTVAVRAHDITVCLERNSVSEFDELTRLGMAVRLALHLRGVPPVSYSLLKDVAVHLLDFSTVAVRPVLHLLAEAEFVKLDTEGNTIKTIIPDIPFYENLFDNLGEVIGSNNFSEPETLTLFLVDKLAKSPMAMDSVYNFGAEKSLVDRIVDIGTQGAFLTCKRARGRSVLMSPTYFPENSQAYADLVSAGGSSRVKKVLELLKRYQGWPLSKIKAEKAIADHNLNQKDLNLITMLAGEGFVPPPGITTSHAGTNYFIFGPRPSLTQLPSYKRPVYEAAMALVAAVRQGQFLPNSYAIKYPKSLLRAFKQKGYLEANTEAIEQYRQVAALRVGRLETTKPGWSRLRLIDLPENIEAVDMAIDLISAEEPSVKPDENIILSLRAGEKYVESLIGRKRLIQDTVVPPDEESKNAIDNFLLKGR